jgi:hypothetical protein
MVGGLKEGLRQVKVVAIAYLPSGGRAFLVVKQLLVGICDFFATECGSVYLQQPQISLKAEASL